MLRAWFLAVGGLILIPAAARAASDGSCLTAPVPALGAPAQPLRFGITPLLAGSAGSLQQQAVPEDPLRAAAALRALQPSGRRLVIRINRIFESDGAQAVATASSLAERYAQMGFDVEAQIRYHPSPAQDGDLGAWERFVRSLVRALAPDQAVVALTITNEVNFPISSNTSDGAYRDAVDALVRGIVAARDELDRQGRPDVAIGFSYAYRYAPSSDASFWKSIGARATPAFLAAVDYVGVQLYPGLVFPPVLLPGQTAGSATLDALSLVRGCYMPLATLGPRVALWITENGYATNLGHTEAAQAADLRSTVDDVARYSGTLGITDYRYFNLRDNRPGGTDLFDDVGLLRADYTAKPAFPTYRDLIARDGADASARRCTWWVALPRLRRGERYLRARGFVDGGRAGVRLARAGRGRRLAAIALAPGTHRVRLELRTSRGRLLRLRRAAASCLAIARSGAA